MNTTAIISAEIQVSDIPIFEALFKRLKAKKIVVESKKDDTEMTQEAIFLLFLSALLLYVFEHPKRK